MSTPPPPPTAAGPRQRAWQAWLPQRTRVNARERWRIVAGAVLGIALVAVTGHATAAWAAPWPWIVAPMGASAVLVFAVPGSPFAQPWSVLGGHLVSALVGVACARWLGPPLWAAAPAVGLAIALMLALRCLHPPGGATALLATWLGAQDPSFALLPVAGNAVLMVAAGWLWNNATGRAYPPRRAPPRRAEASDADLDAVLARYNQVLDIGRDQLKALLEDTQLQAYQRKLADTRCADIMSRQLVTVQRHTPLAQARALFSAHRIKALPVVDAHGALVGIVTPADVVRAALRQPAPGQVGEVMTRQVRVVSADRHLVELVPLFGSTGHHHIPVVGPGQQLQGIITQSDVVAALVKPGPRAGG